MNRLRFRAGMIVGCLAAGCAQQNGDRWNLFRAASRPASESQPSTLPGEGDDEPMNEVGRLTLQRDRLLAANRILQKEVDELRRREIGLSARLAELRREIQEQSADLEARRRELQQAMDAMHKSRDEWETMLADRQRRIELLTNQVQRLERELDRMRRGQTAAPPGN